jgi:hypothetical protein
MTSVWLNHRGADLLQGDYLPGCAVPIVGADFMSDVPEEFIDVETRSLIIITQSCDLANEKTFFAAMCPIVTVDAVEVTSPDFVKKGEWEKVRKGRIEGLHMLPPFEDKQSNRAALVVDFRQVFSLPVAYLQRHAGSLGDRWRLQSPFLEHFSQAFARFFMRVGLPVSIPAFK